MITMKDLLECGVHFGHQTRRWNPKMKKFIFGARKNIYIIDLQKTLRYFKYTYNVVRDAAAEGQTVLFVGTKKQARSAVKEHAERCGMPYVATRWLDGMLTNYPTMKKSIRKLEIIEQMEENGQLDMLTKKEALMLLRKKEKLSSYLEGFRHMKKLPDMMFVVDAVKEHIAVKEAKRMGMKVIAPLDTNCDPDVIDYPIPGNDDAIRSINLFCKEMANAIIEGKAAYAEANGGEAEEVSTGEMEAVMAEAAAEAAAAPATATEAEIEVEVEKLVEEKAAPKVEAKGDDLTKIAGVGKVYQGKLNDEGFHTFTDVANMTDAQIQVMEEKYSFKGNFRDSVASAKEYSVSKDQNESNIKKVTSISKTGENDVLEITVAKTATLSAKSSSGADDKKNLSFTTKKVFYGTDREEITKKEKLSYNSNRGNQISYGYCEVSIPSDHHIGEIERPSLRKWEFKENPERHVVLLSINALERKFFFQAINKYLDGVEKSDSFIFVHGFNVNFDEAAYRTAQMAHDLKFDGVPLFYSWPSKGTLGKSAYVHDENNIDWCFPYLEQFILEVANDTKSSSITLIAHSMGNQFLTKALNNISKNITDKIKISIKQIILTAPDIDADIFKRDIIPKFKNFDARVTLYASSTDRALKYSKKINGYKRAGDTGEDIIIEEGIDTVDATNVDTSFMGHSYYGDNRSVMSDINEVIKENKDPDNRFELENISTEKGIYWQFRK